MVPGCKSSACASIFCLLIVTVGVLENNIQYEQRTTSCPMSPTILWICTGSFITISPVGPWPEICFVRSNSATIAVNLSFPNRASERSWLSGNKKW